MCAGRGVDAGDPHIEGLGNWAASKHDRANGEHLVSRAKSQDVVGVDYLHHIKAVAGDAGGTALVAESGIRKLISFDAE
uniref:Uncharacterized protein n=1 Tax=Oryza nivara TaxID=4536 RepID=A0A0E0IUX5_ORYNI